MSCCFCSSKCFSTRSCILFFASSPSSYQPVLSLWAVASCSGAIFHRQPLFLSFVLKSDYDHQTARWNIQQHSGCCFRRLHRNTHHRRCSDMSLCLVDVQKTIRGAVAQLSRMCYLALSGKCVFKKGNIPAYLFLFYDRYWNLDVIVWARVQLPSVCVCVHLLLLSFLLFFSDCALDYFAVRY